MRNRRSIDVVAILLACTALAVVFISLHEFAPRVDRKLHEAIGTALAKAAVDLLGQGGQITIITRDTESFQQPAIDIALDGFKREIRRAHTQIALTQLVQVDPLRPVEVPPGAFFEVLRRTPAQHVIVSFMGPPLLTDEQRNKLGAVRPKVVAFCSGSLAETIDLRWLFSAGLLHAAVVTRPPSRVTAENARNISQSFADLYMTVTAADVSKLPAPVGASL